jgi:hypothetical protein
VVLHLPRTLVLHPHHHKVQHRLRPNPDRQRQEVDRMGHLRLHGILFRRYGWDGNVPVLSVRACAVSLSISS